LSAEKICFTKILTFVTGGAIYLTQIDLYNGRGAVHVWRKWFWCWSWASTPLL